MKLKSLLLGIGVLFLITILFVRCTKINPTDIGTDLLPSVDNIHTFDTTLRVYTDNYLYNDSSFVGFSETHALGLIENDPVFGKTDAQIYFGIAPSSGIRYPFVNIDSVVGIDSAVLSLAYAGVVYGDSMSQQRISVYEISDENFQDSTGYYISTPKFTTTGPELAGSIVNFWQFDDEKTVVVKRDTQKVSNVLRIPIDAALGTRFAAYDTTSVYTTTARDSAFQKVFNGLAVKIDGAGGYSNRALAYFNVSNENTKLTFYYRVIRNGVVDTLATDFRLARLTNGSAFSANLIERTAAHEYADLSLATPVTNPDKILIQSSPGSYAVVKVPGLSGIPNSIIHRADLVINPVSSAGENFYTKPDLLFLDLIDSANQRFLSVRNDFVYNPTNYTYDVNTFGGFIRNNVFVFNLTRYVQSVVTKGEYNYAFRLYAPKWTRIDISGSTLTDRWVSVNSQIAKGRVVVHGGGSAPESMVVRIIYSKI